MHNNHISTTRLTKITSLPECGDASGRATENMLKHDSTTSNDATAQQTQSSLRMIRFRLPSETYAAERTPPGGRHR